MPISARTRFRKYHPDKLALGGTRQRLTREPGQTAIAAHWQMLFHGGGTASFRKFWGGNDGMVYTAYQDSTSEVPVKVVAPRGTRALDPIVSRLLGTD